MDGGLNPIMGSIVDGGVIKDHKKNLLGGFALNKGMGSVIEARLWGILEELKLDWKTGFKMVVVESDSQNAILLLNKKTHLNHQLFSIIQACKALIEDK
ncbi:hypothetical protein Ddye_001877 [Dipteronia dyeriana]|uniref:RNase H type-1 domain-containing protein n=1 Tax=Dipteronia dyeriana TaxID=168575 RepID=A0AAD9XQ15_9ROSI|nr:hypothetical protein Ddye_001877 [Dipteronia dyeriana]